MITNYTGIYMLFSVSIQIFFKSVLCKNQTLFWNSFWYKKYKTLLDMLLMKTDQRWCGNSYSSFVSFCGIDRVPVTACHTVF